MKKSKSVQLEALLVDSDKVLRVVVFKQGDLVRMVGERFRVTNVFGGQITLEPIR